MGGKKENGRKRMIAGKETNAGAENKNGTGRRAERNKMEKKSGNLIKIGAKLKERRSSYGNVEMMLKRNKNERRGEEKREWEETSAETRKRQDR